MAIDFSIYIQDPPKPKTVSLTRGQIGVANGLDVTAKSAAGWAKKLAPSWALVLGHQRGSLPEAEFERLYIQTIAPRESSYLFPMIDLWHYGLANDSKICFLCYCPDMQFCHTHTLINYIVGTWPVYFTDGREVPL